MGKSKNKQTTGPKEKHAKKRKNQDQEVGDPPSKKSQDNENKLDTDVKSKKNKSYKNFKAKKIKESKAARREKQQENFEKRDTTDSTSYQQAIEYLHQWQNDRKNWVFKKVRQVWLLKHIYHDALMTDENFSVLLEYLEGLKGQSRDATVKEAETILQAYEADSDEEGTTEGKFWVMFVDSVGVPN